jgi:putative transposase
MLSQNMRLTQYVELLGKVESGLPPRTTDGELDRLPRWHCSQTGENRGGVGRYKACLVDSGSYFLACSRYIELNPVRAWMVARPGDYPWSSYGAHAGEREDPLLMAHPAYLALGADPAARAAAYRALFDDALPDELVAEIRAYLQQQKALGTDRFRAWVEARTGRFAAARPLGRPPRRTHCP